MCVVCRRAARVDGWTPRRHDDDEEEEEEEPGSATFIVPKYKTVVQPAPSHDGSFPIFAAYEVPETTSETEAELRPLRAAFGCVVYDTTPTANPARSARLARALFERTRDVRRNDKTHDEPDRIEVVTFPLPRASDEERAHACVRHYEREVRSRLTVADKAEAVSWFLPERFMDSRHSRMILAINNFYADDGNDEVPSWELSLVNPAGNPVSMKTADESRYGSFIKIQWLPQKELWAEIINPGYTAQKCVIWGGLVAFEHIGAALADATNEVSLFYTHYMGDGLLDRYLDNQKIQVNADS